jgi:hypothetical protein
MLWDTHKIGYVYYKGNPWEFSELCFTLRRHRAVNLASQRAPVQATAPAETPNTSPIN